MKDMVYYLNLDCYTLAFSIVMILIAVWMALWFAEKLSKPVGRLAEAAKKVGSGDFDIKVMEENTKDEIAFLSKFLIE